MSHREPARPSTQRAIPKPTTSRRAVLRLGVPATLAVLGVQPAVAEPIDGKGNDVCPCFFGISEAVLNDDGSITVSGPCAVANPPEDVTVRVRVQGAHGARAIGSESFSCTGSEENRGTFWVSAPIRGASTFETGDSVEVHATVHLNPDDKPAVVGTWTWDGTLA